MLAGVWPRPGDVAHAAHGERAPRSAGGSQIYDRALPPAIDQSAPIGTGTRPIGDARVRNIGPVNSTGVQRRVGTGLTPRIRASNTMGTEFEPQIRASRSVGDRFTLQIQASRSGGI